VPIFIGFIIQKKGDGLFRPVFLLRFIGMTFLYSRINGISSVLFGRLELVWCAGKMAVENKGLIFCPFFFLFFVGMELPLPTLKGISVGPFWTALVYPGAAKNGFK
jgi:hypothetical protein